MSVCVGNVNTNDGFFDVTLSIVINNLVRGAWGAALINMELYELHVKPLVARCVAKHKARGVADDTGDSAMRDIAGFTRRKVRSEGHDTPHWDVLLHWAQQQDAAPCSTRDEQTAVWGVGPWESDES